jgi:hypothetical protein
MPFFAFAAVNTACTGTRTSIQRNNASYLLQPVSTKALIEACDCLLLQTELSDVRSVEIPALESRYREALSKLNSEVLRLKHAAKEAEAVAAAAQAEVLASSTQPTLQAELNDAVRERERCAVGLIGWVHLVRCYSQLAHPSSPASHWQLKGQ